MLAAAIRESRALVTLDLDFASPVRFPPADTAGIAVLRVRDRPGRDDLDVAVGRLVIALAAADLAGRLWIVEARHASGSMRSLPTDDPRCGYSTSGW